MTERRCDARSGRRRPAPVAGARGTLFALAAARVAALALASVLVAASCGGPSSAPAPPAAISPEAAARLERLPPVMLWAWQRPEDLRFVDPTQFGVAFLARTIRLRGAEARVEPRLQPLRVPDGAVMLAVVRVESDETTRPALDAAQRERIAREVGDLARDARLAGVQIDFDARESERAFYRDLLFDARARVPEDKILGMTALASWCLGDAWIDTLPVDEVVPMVFRMGADDRRIRLHLESGGDFRSPVCRQSVGVATDEPPLRLGERRLYVFHPTSWTEAAVRAIPASKATVTP